MRWTGVPPRDEAIQIPPCFSYRPPPELRKRVNATRVPSGESAGKRFCPVAAIRHVLPDESDRTSIGPWQLGHRSAVW